VLLDTHALLWFLTDPDRLSRFAYGHITMPTNEVLVSVGSLWEITIKLSIGKLSLDEPFEVLMPAQLAAERI
jgi:PIN domain nuclease of toxin-antitoxin system